LIVSESSGLVVVMIHPGSQGRPAGRAGGAARTDDSRRREVGNGSLTKTAWDDSPGVRDPAINFDVERVRPLRRGSC
jgi:hypothetical protein